MLKKIPIFDFYQMNSKQGTNETEQQLDALALLPIALAIGTGTQIIQDLAITIMSGLLFVIVINLYIIPLFFHFIRAR